MKSFCLIFSSVIFLSLFLSCSEKDDDKKCGESSTWDADVISNFSTSSEQGTDSRDLYYEVTSTPEDICTAERLSVNFVVGLRDFITAEPLNLTAIEGKLYWAVGYHENVLLDFSQGVAAYYGKIEGVNQEPAFGTSPGWIGATIIFHMRTLGNETSDRQYIEDNFKTAQIHLAYTKSK